MKCAWKPRRITSGRMQLEVMNSTGQWEKIAGEPSEVVIRAARLLIPACGDV